jgi:hypothetical protein
MSGGANPDTLRFNHFLAVLSDASRCRNDSDCHFATLSINPQSQTELDGLFWRICLFKQKSIRVVRVKVRFSCELDVTSHFLESQSKSRTFWAELSAPVRDRLALCLQSRMGQSEVGHFLPKNARVTKVFHPSDA